jgi:hypothetical protein
MRHTVGDIRIQRTPITEHTYNLRFGNRVCIAIGRGDAQKWLEGVILENIDSLKQFNSIH